MEAWADILIWACRIAALALILMTAAPFLRTGAWAVRVLDFPRLQISALGAITAGAYAPLLSPGRWTPIDAALLALLLAAAAWQFSHVFRYSPLRARLIGDAERVDFRLLISNLDFANDQRLIAAEQLRRLDPDVLLLIEPDPEWLVALHDLRETYPHRAEHIAGDGLGIALWSRLELRGTTLERLVSDDRVSIHTTLLTPRGDEIRLVGLHPVPPGLPSDDGDLYNSRVRDAELMKVAAAVADAPTRNWVVAGDFNDVAWSHTTRLFENLSGLNDPRVGRGLFNTYNAKIPVLRYPLDHIFISNGFRVAEMERIRIAGSDHFAIHVGLHLDQESRDQTEADGEDRHEAATVISEGDRDAALRGK